MFSNIIWQSILLVGAKIILSFPDGISELLGEIIKLKRKEFEKILEICSRRWGFGENNFIRKPER